MRRTILAAIFATALGAVEEVSDEKTFKKILAENPAVVVDFYSQTCGPCIMMAPVFKDAAKELPDVKFIKVDVQRSYVGVQIRSMPTFHFYLQGKLENQFSGASEQQLKMFAQQLGKKAEDMNIEVSLGAIEAFYQQHDPSKLDKARRPPARPPAPPPAPPPARHLRLTARSSTSQVDEIYEKYPAYKLVQILKKKYGKAPEFTKKKKPKPAGGGDGRRAEESKGVDIRKMDIEDLKAEVYRRESAQEEKEEELMAKKNQRRRDKVFGAKLEEGEEPTAAHAQQADAAKIAIIGGGPAGVTAAIYAARAGLKPVLIAPAMGGQLMSKGVNVENYPGLTELSGGDIIKLMKRQAMRFAATFEEESVLEVDLKQRPFVVRTNTSSLTTHTIVIATGADSRWLGVPGEEEHKGGGISSCATCDGFLYSGKPVMVVGGGDTAMEEALVLSRTSSHVTLVHRKDSFRASEGSQKAVLNNPKITIVWNTTVKEFKGNDGGMLTTAVLEDVTNPENVTELAVDGAFVAIGHIPNTWLFKDQLEMEESGYLVTRGRSTHCSVDGVFAAGDVADWVYRQAVTSAGSGSSAALDAERWLSENQLATGGDDEAAEECMPEDYESWTMKQIRKELKERGVDVGAECRGCSEKREFIEVLCRHM